MKRSFSRAVAMFLMSGFAIATSAVTVPPTSASGAVAPKPLYRDPVFDGAADPVVIWNRAERKWFMFYTNRRANQPGLRGVSWVHGTRIGIAESVDGGVTWTHRGTAAIPLGSKEDSHWAPDVVYHDGVYHMFLSFVPGMHEDWSGARFIHHLTSNDLIHWADRGRLELASNRVIDAGLIRMPDGEWRLYYNNEPDRKAIYLATSPDLHEWTDRGKVIGDRAGEGPKVFWWKGNYWMIVDQWQGLGVYRSADADRWVRQPDKILAEPGVGNDDQVKGGHADVVVSNDRAYLFYFTHPGRRGPDAAKDGYEQRRSSIQVVELELTDGWLTCERDEPTRIRLTPPRPAADVVYPSPLIEQRADPWIWKHHDGFYYFIATVPEYDRIELRRARAIAKLPEAQAQVIWRRHESGPMSWHIWAPELHAIDGKWYVYFAAGKAEAIWDIRMYVLQNDSANPIAGKWVEKGQLKSNWESFSLDATTFEHRGRRYLVWAQKDPRIRGNTNLYISEMLNPWTLQGRQVMLSRPEFPWEQVGYWVNEGPAVIIRHGRVFLSYSASATDHNYCMGLLTASADADLLDARAWTKSPIPVFRGSNSNGEFGPGHNCFVLAEDDETDLFVYHSRSYKDIDGNPLDNPDRHTRVQALKWKSDGTPDFREPRADSVAR